MEKEKKSRNKGLIALLIVIIIGLAGYICYDAGLFNNLFGKEEPKPGSQETKTNKVEDVKIVSEEFMGEDHLEVTQYLIAKINGEWQELDTDVLVYFGEKDNKLYYSNDKAFKYIDLNSNNYEPTTWIEFGEKDYASGTFIGYLMPTAGILKNDTIYYIINSGPNKIRTLNINATKYSEIKEVGTKLNDFSFYLSDDNVLYYSEFIEGVAYGKFVSYNLDTKERKVVIEENVYLTDFYKDKALVQTNGDEYKLYLYNLKTLEKEYIGEYEHFAGIIGNTVYYLDGDTAMKYENGKSTKIYEYDPPRNIDAYAVRGLIVYNENLLKYSLGSGSNDFYVSNGKRISEKTAQTLVDKYEVHMKDGNQKIFYQTETDKQYIDQWS